MPTNLAAIAVFAVMLGVLGGLAYLAVSFGPRTEVQVTVPARELSTDLSVHASADFDSVDAASGQVPGTRISRSTLLTLALPVEGQVAVGKAPAQLIVTITNSSAEDVVLPRGAMLIGPSGREFSLDLETPVPAGQQAVQQVTALKPGAEANLPAGAALRARASGLFAVSAVVQHASVPGVDEMVPGITGDDVIRLRQLARRMESSQTLAQRLLADMPGLVLPETAEVLVRPIGATEQIGDRGDAIVVDAELLVTALTVDDATVAELARQLLASGRAGELIESTLDVQLAGPATVLPDGSVRAPVLVSGLFAPEVDRAEIEAAVKGMKASEVEAFLAERYGAIAARVDRSPSFWPWLPRRASRIDVVLTASAPDTDDQVAAPPD